jgi:hypothetical protein
VTRAVPFFPVPPLTDAEQLVARLSQLQVRKLERVAKMNGTTLAQHIEARIARVKRQVATGILMPSTASTGTANARAGRL